jgi:hypothetical protein
VSFASQSDLADKKITFAELADGVINQLTIRESGLNWITVTVFGASD